MIDLRVAISASLLSLLIALPASAQDGNYFHVDDFFGLPSGHAPIEGTKSLWCGRRAGPDFCEPGTGHSWDESWESCDFDVSGDMTFAFDIAYDSEPISDVTCAEYLDAQGNWVTLGTCYDFRGFASESFVIPASLLGPTVRFRFRFQSDSSWDNEDCLSVFKNGACIIDNLSVQSGTTLLNFENFESESPMALATLSGVWVAGPHWGCEPIPASGTSWGSVKGRYR